MANIPDSAQDATPKQWWVRSSKQFLYSKGISPQAKILWMCIHSHGNRPIIGQNKLMEAIGVSKWETLIKYLKEIKQLVPGWGWKQQPAKDGRYSTNLYESLPSPLSDFGVSPLSENGVSAGIRKSDNKKEKGSRSITLSPEATTIRDFLLSIPIDDIPTKGFAIEAETMTLLNRKAREMFNAGITLDQLHILKAFYDLPSDPLDNWDNRRAKTLSELLRKWGTELKRAITWRRKTEKTAKPGNIVAI